MKVTDYPHWHAGRILNGLRWYPQDNEYDNTYSFATSSNKTLVDKGICRWNSNSRVTNYDNPLYKVLQNHPLHPASGTNQLWWDNDTRVPTQSENDALVGSNRNTGTSNPS